MLALSRRILARGAILAGLIALAASTARAEHTPGFPWLDKNLSADARAALLVPQLTLDEKIHLVHSQFTQRDPEDPPPAGPNDDVGYVRGIPRLGIPPLHMADGNVGVANPWNARDNDEATALPSGLALASSWDPDLAFAAGAMAGGEARRKGFNVLLAGSVNLVRDPHGGRSFEYAGEDPILSGIMVGALIRGIQSQHVISTAKHFALNDRENGRFLLSAEIDEKSFRESDLRAFQIAIETGDPGAVMCAYNKVGGVYACENPFLLQKVLRGNWNYRGWVMSDWGAVHSTVASAIAGLDQESGDKYDEEVYFGAPLKKAVEDGAVPMARLDEMVGRILRSMFAAGLFDEPAAPAAIDWEAHAALAQKVAEQGSVLLKNARRLLPLQRGDGDIAIIGAHADIAVLAGGGSSQVRPVGGPALTVQLGGTPMGSPKMVWDPSSPLAALRKEDPTVEIRYADGSDTAAAVALAKEARTVILFAHQWMSEGWDVPSLSLPDNQDALIAAVAAANPRTIVVLETGGPVLMPWLDRVGAVLEAWYPGQRGGDAIARLLFGRVAPSGRLPVSFPQSEAQLPDHAAISFGSAASGPVHYSEGTAVGYRWYEMRNARPLFPFGFGLSYTRFDYSDLRVMRSTTNPMAIEASFTVRNSGGETGTDVAQLYVTLPEDRPNGVRKLAGWKRVTLRPGEAKRIKVALDPHALQLWNSATEAWEMPSGSYQVALGASARDQRLAARIKIELHDGAPAIAREQADSR